MPVGFKVASAFVEVKADTTGLRDEVKRGIRTATSGTHRVKITANLDATKAKSDIRKLAQRQTMKLKVSLDSNQAKAEIRKLGRDITVKVKVEADTTRARQQIDALARSRGLTLRADADTGAASAQLAFLTRARTVMIHTQVNQTSVTQITNNLNNATRSAGRTTGSMRLLRLAILGLTVAPGILGAVAGGLGTLKTATMITVPAILALGTAFAALRTGFSGIGSALSAGFKSPAGGGGVAQQISRARQIEDAKRSLARAQRDLQYTEQDSARAIANAQRQVQDAQQNLRDAELQSAEDRADAAERVRDAQEDLSRTYADVARANAQAVRRVKDAEDDLRDAQEKARRAQLDLVEARRTAAEQLVDLNNRLKSAELDQRDAVLDLKEAQEALQNLRVQTDPARAVDEYTRAIEEQRAAQEALNRVRAKGSEASDMEKAQAEAAFASASAKAAQAAENLAKAQRGQTSADDIERAQLNYDRAKQALAEQSIETERLQQKAEQANRAGVEGSELVQNAKEDLEDANGRVADSVESLRDAEQEAARTAEDGARRVRDAQEAVTDSLKEQQKVYRTSARAIADAQREVADAQQGVRDAHQQAARDMLSANESVEDAVRNLSEAYQDAGAAGAAAADEFGDAMRKLSPNARSFVQAVLDIAPAWRTVKLSVQDALFSGWDVKLRDLSSAVLPSVQKGLTDTAGLFNLMGKSSADAFIDLANSGTLDQLFASLNGAMKPLMDTPAHLIRAFSQIGVAAGPALTRVTTAVSNAVKRWSDKINREFKTGDLEKRITGAVDRIAESINGIKNNPHLKEFIQAMRDLGPRTGEIMSNIGNALMKVTTALGYGVGALLLEIANALAEIVLALPTEFIQGLVVFAGTLKLLLTIQKVAGLIRAWAAAQYALNGAMLLSPMTWILVGIAALVAVIVVIATKTDWFSRAWKASWEAIKTAFNFVLDFIKNNWPMILAILTGPVGIAVGLIVKYWDEISSGFSAAWNWIKQNVLFPIRDFFTVKIPGWGKALREAVVKTWDEWTNSTKRTLDSWKNWATSKFNSFRDGVAKIVNGIRDRWTSFVTSLRNTWQTGMNWIKSKWDSISSSVRGAFSSFGTRVRNSVQGAVNGIRDVWNRLEGIFKKPVRFLVNTVVNSGIVGSINWVLGKVGVGTRIPKVGLPKGFATGGPVHGPGTGTSDSIPAMLSNGEHVLTAEDVKALGGHQAVMALRQSGGRSTAKRKDGVVHAAFGGAIMDFFSDPIGSISKGGKWLWDQGAKWTRKAAAKFVDLAYGRMINPILNSVPFGGASKSLVKGVPGYFKGKIVDYIKGVGDKKQKEEDAKSGLGNFKPGAGVSQWSGVVRTALSQVGQSQGLLNTTLRRMNQESGGNPRAVNRWDINWQRGYPSVGLMQVIRPTYQAYAGRYRNKGPFMYGTSIDPLANVYASMRYALSAYGSLSRAYNRPGGYANGGMARGLSIVGERGPELINAGSGSRVSSSSETRALLQGGVTIESLTIQVDGTLDMSSPADRKRFAKEMVSDIKEAIRKDDLGRGR